MKMHRQFILSGAIALTLAGAIHAQIQGPSTGSTPYILPVPGPFALQTYSLFTTDNTGATPDDQVGGYGMVGIPDGLGAMDNGNGTFTVLMNHELGATNGIVRAHGSNGAFVSKWTLDKNTLAVTAGSDLIQSVFTWNTTTTSYNPAGTTAFTRFCSADLPNVSAFSFGGLGTTNRIYMTGEESGQEGRAFASMVTGPDAGKSYELPRTGKFSWENAVASPFAQQKTIVMGMADTNSGTGILMYVGNKINSGFDIDKAGLTNGSLYGLVVGGGAPQTEVQATEFGIGAGSKPFTFKLAPNSGNVENLTGASVEASLAAGGAGVGTTKFQRTEDGVWDSLSNDTYYFVTTDNYDAAKDGLIGSTGRSRLWKMKFTDMANPELGGNLSILLDGTEAGQMFDNLTVDKASGNLLLQEDVGGQAHNGKVWLYDVAADSLTMLTKHDPARFGDVGVAVTSPFNNDEENSGIIDITDIMAGSILNTGAPGERWYLLDDQAHYTTGITTAQVQGGQLQMLHVVPEPNVAMSVIGGLGMLAGLRRRRV